MMKQTIGLVEKIGSRAVNATRFVGARRNYSVHARQVNNAFLVVFAQYEKAFEELAKV